MKNPVKGQKIYVPSAYYVYRGEDDFEGGIATINRIEYSKHLPEGHVNYIMVGVEENKGTMYNYILLMREQEEFAKKYEGKIAHPNPDMREEFNCPHEGWR